MVTFFSRAIRLICFSGILGCVGILFGADASAIPVGDAYETGQAEFQGSPSFQPRNEVPPVLHPSLHPGLNDKIVFHRLKLARNLLCHYITSIFVFEWVCSLIFKA